MADRQKVHPQSDSPSRLSASSSNTSGTMTEFAMKPYSPSYDMPVPHPTGGTGTYVIQIPKDQIYRIPPPENEYKFKNYTRQSKRKSSHCRCCCWTFSIILTVAILAAIAVGFFCLIIRPQTPKYSIDFLTFSGFNLTASSTISPRIDVVLMANNPNKRISIDYRSGGYAAAYHNGLRLCDGALPIFHQPRQNVTLIETALGGTSSGLVLGNESRDQISKDVRAGIVPLRLNLRSPVRLKVGDVMTWTITVKVRCDVAVDRLSAGANMLSRSCEFGVKLW